MPENKTIKKCARVGCPNTFEANRADAKFCSDACRVKASRKGVVGKVESIEVDEVKTVGLASTPVKEYDRDYHLKNFQKMGLETVKWITTGIPDFDALTMIPRGRVTQIQGPYGVGKTTLCLNMIRGLRDKKVLYIDSEAALNPELLVGLELNSDNFTLYNESAFIEDIYDVILAAVEHAKFDMIVFDSLASCTFRTEAAGEAADANIGQKAKIMNKLMRLVPMELKRTNTALVIINQEREVINSYAPIKYTPGGMGVPYTCSLIVQLKSNKSSRFPKGGPPFKGQEVTAEIIKSKVNEPWRKATFKLFYGGYNDSSAETRDTA